MTLSETIFLICFVWNFFGLFALYVIEGIQSSPIYWCNDGSYLHYSWLLEHFNCNRVWIIAMCVFLNVVCPIATIFHWIAYGIYKLFTM